MTYLSSSIFAALDAISLNRLRFHANGELSTLAARPELSENSASRKFAVAVTCALSDVFLMALAIFANDFISAREYDSGGGANFEVDFFGG